MKSHSDYLQIDRSGDLHKKRKLLTHYRFLTTNLVGSEEVKMKSLRSDYIPKNKSRDHTKKGMFSLTTDFSLQMLLVVR